MHARVPLPFLVFLILFPLPSWGGAESVSDYTAQRLSGLFSDQGSHAHLRHTPLALYQTSFTTTFYTPSVTSPRLRDLAPETDQTRAQGLLSSTTWMNGALVTETEVAQNQGGSAWFHNRHPGDLSSDASQRMIRLGLTGTAGSLHYGILSRSAGPAFLIGPDQARREVWGEWTSGWTTLRSAIGQQWNNVVEDAGRPRLEQTYGRFGLAWKRPIWPEMTLTYAHNSLNSTLEPLGIAPQRSHSHSLESALAYTGIDWNLRLASSYILVSDLLRGRSEATVRMQMLTAAFCPWNTLTISPALGYREEVQDLSGVRINSPSASIALQYRQNQEIVISAMGNYAGTRSSDGLIDMVHMGGRGRLAWDIQRSQGWTTLISFEAGYNRMANRATPAAGTEDISGLVRVVLASL